MPRRKTRGYHGDSYKYIGVDGNPYIIKPCSAKKMPELKAWFQLLGVVIETIDNPNSTFQQIYVENTDLRLVTEQIFKLCKVSENTLDIDMIYQMVIASGTIEKPELPYLRLLNNLI